MVGKYKLNTIEILISKALIKLYVSHDEFVLISNVLKKYNEIKKFWNICGTHYINMINLSRETCERNGIETIVDNDGILPLNEKNIDGQLGHKNLQEITIKYN